MRSETLILAFCRGGEGCTRQNAGGAYHHRPSHLYNAGTEHVGFSTTRQTLLAPSAKHRDVAGESHEAGGGGGVDIARPRNAG